MPLVHHDVVHKYLPWVKYIPRHLILWDRQVEAPNVRAAVGAQMTTQGMGMQDHNLPCKTPPKISGRTEREHHTAHQHAKSDQETSSVQ